MDDEGGTDGAAGVASGRLDVDVFEGGLAADFAVGDGVHSAATGEGDVVAAVFFVEGVEEVEEGFLIHGLDAAGDVFVALGEGLVLFAGGAEEGFKPGSEHGTDVGRAIVPGV